MGLQVAWPRTRPAHRTTMDTIMKRKSCGLGAGRRRACRRRCIVIRWMILRTYRRSPLLVVLRPGTMVVVIRVLAFLGSVQDDAGQFGGVKGGACPYE